MDGRIDRQTNRPTEQWTNKAGCSCVARDKKTEQNSLFTNYGGLIFTISSYIVIVVKLVEGERKRGGGGRGGIGHLIKVKKVSVSCGDSANVK